MAWLAGLFLMAVSAQARGKAVSAPPRIGSKLALAAKPVSRWSGELGVGVAMPGTVKQQRASMEFSNSAAAAATALYGVNSWLDVGLEVGRTAGSKLESAELPDVNGDGRTEKIKANGDVRFSVTEIAPILRAGKRFHRRRFSFRPYAVVGAGLYHGDGTPGKITLESARPGITMVDPNLPPILIPAGSSSQVVEVGPTSGNYFGANAGAGLALGFRKDTLLLSLETRYNRVWAEGSAIGIMFPQLKLSLAF